MNVLTLRPSTETWRAERGIFRRRVVERRRDFVDLVVDGRPLSQWFDPVRAADLAPPLSARERRDAAWAVETLVALLGETTGPYQDGCVPLLVCGDDPYCGVLGARVAIQQEVVRWHVGWHLLGSDGSVEEHTEPDPSEPRELVFDRDRYEEVLRPALTRFRATARGAMAFQFVPPVPQR